MDKKLIFNYKGTELTFETDGDLFSPMQIDRGTAAMLEEAELRPGDRIIDLGCGYGVVGVCATKITGPENVYMTDINEKAVAVSRRNMLENCPESEPFLSEHIFVNDGMKNFSVRDADIILSNPPYHTDFSVAKEFIEDGFRCLKTGGRMYMVTKRRTWYENKLKSVFGGVRVSEKDGYFVFVSEKREKKAPSPEKNKGGMSKKLLRKQNAKKRK